MNGGYRPWGHKELDTTDPAIKKLTQIFLNVAGQCQAPVPRQIPQTPDYSFCHTCFYRPELWKLALCHFKTGCSTPVIFSSLVFVLHLDLTLCWLSLLLIFHFHFQSPQIDSNGTPLQYSCLENPMEGRAWQAAVHGVAESWTRLSDFPFTFHFSLSCIGEGNGNPLQCSCLENPRDSGAWWTAVYGVALSRTRLKRLSSSSSSRK